MDPQKKFLEMKNDRHKYARDWKKRTGGKVFGYFCIYAPEEIMYAAGILPVRIIGGHATSDITEAHITTQWCPFSRDCLAQGLEGKYDYLDGLVSCNSCYHIQQTYDIWERHNPTAFKHYIWVPFNISNRWAKDCLASEFETFRKAIEDWSGRTISDGDLDQAIDVYNTNRGLLVQAYRLRKQALPSISGSEAMNMVLASSLMDKEEHNKLLQQLLAGAKSKGTQADGRVRLMAVGSENDDSDFLEFIETLGAQVVIDDHCTGSRYFWNNVDPGQDRLAALASRYAEIPPCSQKEYYPERKRFSYMLERFQEYDAQGVIILIQKFCDSYLFDLPSLQSFLAQHNIPNLFLETDVVNRGGQFRTRVEAFLETLQLGV